MDIAQGSGEPATRDQFQAVPTAEIESATSPASGAQTEPESDQSLTTPQQQSAIEGGGDQDFNNQLAPVAGGPIATPAPEVQPGQPVENQAPPVAPEAVAAATEGGPGAHTGLEGQIGGTPPAESPQDPVAKAGQTGVETLEAVKDPGAVLGENDLEKTAGETPAMPVAPPTPPAVQTATDEAKMASPDVAPIIQQGETRPSSKQELESPALSEYGSRINELTPEKREEFWRTLRQVVKDSNNLNANLRLLGQLMPGIVSKGPEPTETKSGEAS